MPVPRRTNISRRLNQQMGSRTMKNKSVSLDTQSNQIIEQVDTVRGAFMGMKGKIEANIFQHRERGQKSVI